MKGKAAVSDSVLLVINQALFSECTQKSVLWLQPSHTILNQFSRAVVPVIHLDTKQQWKIVFRLKMLRLECFILSLVTQTMVGC